MKCLLILFLLCHAALAGDFEILCSDRLAIEAVYHEQRLGAKCSIEHAMPQDALQTLVQIDLRKEAALRMVYGVTVTPAMTEAEVQRIDLTTRSPEVLAEIKAALGNDSVRYAQSFIKPIIVERELQRNFKFDDSVHAVKRTEAELARKRLLGGVSLEDMQSVTWQLTPRPETDIAEVPAGPTVPVQANGQSSSYTVEATVQLAQVLGSPVGEDGEEHLFYFDELHPKLQQVLAVQLQQAGDVSAVIEGPGGFVVYQAIDKTTETLVVASISIQKLDYTQWLADLEL